MALTFKLHLSCLHKDGRHASVLTFPSVPQKHSAAADIASSLSEDQVPEAFLVMLLIQFSTMIIDRALYLRKAVLGKLIFQVSLISASLRNSRQQ